MARTRRTETTTQRYVILPPRGLQPGPSPALETIGVALHRMEVGVAASAMRTIPGLTDTVSARVKVLDSIHDDGARLVEMSAETMLELRAAQPGLRIIPETFFKPLAFRPEIEVKFKLPVSAVKKAAVKKATLKKAGAKKGAVKATAKKAAVKSAAASTVITLTVRSRADQKPLRRVTVVAFTDFDAREGLQGRTDSQGRVNFDFGTASRKLDRLYALSDEAYWSALRMDITIKTGTVIELDPIKLDEDDAVRHFYGRPGLETGAGVAVGVIDSGVDTAHPDLQVAGGANTVTGEDAGDFGDNGGHHGTHVAGIIAARGAMPGVAPGVTLRSYRVFGKNSDRASNFAIAKAIDLAVQDGCDLINMSLGGGSPDDATRSAIADARAAGSVVIVAAGNDGRQPVSFPASDPRSLAVSAMGRKGTFPKESEPEGDIAAPFGTDKDNFIAAFSNIGPEIDLTGPGVGIVSTVPGGYAVMSGTSMACPAVTGAAARLLAANPQVLSLPRDQARSDEIARILLQAARTLGFEPVFQGQGLPSIS